MKEMRITLVQDRPGRPFYSGSSVSGNLVVEVDEPKSYKDISIDFFGIAKVQWSKLTTTSTGKIGIRMYWSKQTYVDAKLSLWTADQSPDGCLPQGQHVYPFRFNIPRNVPSSFEGSDGTIRYELCGRIGKGFLKFDHEVRCSVQVQQVVVMSDPRLLQPVRREVQRTVSFLCRTYGSIVMTVALPKQGYCIGETLPVHVAIENGSSRRITLKISLDQSVEYIAGSERRTSDKTILCIISDPIAPHVTYNWDPASKIPATEVIDERTCSNMKMSYSLNVTAIIPWEYDAYTAIPLKLGHVQWQPLQPLVQGQPPPKPHDNT